MRDQEVLPVIKLLPHKVQNKSDNGTSEDILTKLSSLTLKDDCGEDLNK